MFVEFQSEKDGYPPLTDTEEGGKVKGQRVDSKAQWFSPVIVIDFDMITGNVSVCHVRTTERS